MHVTHSNSVLLGKLITAPTLIPVLHHATPSCINEPFRACGAFHNVTAVSLGAPYGVVFADDVEKVDVSSLGAALGNHARFPQGASIVFVQVMSQDQLKAWLWQRGQGPAGYTREAAGVAASVAVMLQKLPKNEALVTMGETGARIKWDRASHEAYLLEEAGAIVA